MTAKKSIQKMRNSGMKTGCVASSGCFEDGDKGGERCATDLKQIVVWKGLLGNHPIQSLASRKVNCEV